ncbi:MAG: hypothetical protein H6618_08685 [Deltaproteobacteria bacterium]|nr:hypothetical protein [Deltaproteobacteria bacterium]
MTPSLSSAKVFIDDANTYQKLRITNPVKYGEELARLCDEGHTQKEIAEYLSCNRQMVGRYQRIGKWPANIKEIIQLNRESITNTKILNLASRSLSDSELLTEITSMVGRQQSDGEVKAFPTVTGFNELISKLEAIENRLIALEGQCPGEISATGTTQIPDEECAQVSCNLSWRALLNTAMKPASALLVICITFLTAYLIYQGVVFFSAIDPVPLSAISSAIVSELIPFLSAACFALAVKSSHRVIALAMLLTSILGLGIFMHSSLSSQMTLGSGRYERLAENRRLTVAAIGAHLSALEKIPETYITKRQELMAGIGAERQNLASIDHNISLLENSGGDFHNTGLGYAVWIRIAAMLLNAYLIHLFFIGFRKKNEMSF